MMPGRNHAVLALAFLCSLLMLGTCTSTAPRSLPPFSGGGSDSGGGGMGGR
jgi:hypothetical protein